MKPLAIAVLAASLTGFPSMAFQNPEQQPTSNPDAAKQRQPAPPSPGTGTSQQHEDVPGQQPDPKSPNMAQERQPTGKQQTGKKKSKRQKSTRPSSTTT